MEKFGLGEELYIKMNARGKLLSTYENLKAIMEKGLNISEHLELLTSIDTHWSDYFFGEEEHKKFDERGRNFLHYAALFFTLEEKKEIDSEKIKEFISRPDQPVNDFYKPLQDVNNIRLLDKFIRSCHLFGEEGEEIEGTKTPKEEIKKLKDASFCNESNETGAEKYKKICYFSSALFFIKAHGEVKDCDKIAFNDYLRVCRHFIENQHEGHDYWGRIYIKNFYLLFEHLSQGYENIYQFLKDNPSYDKFDPEFDTYWNYMSNMYRLEVRKAKLILDSGAGRDWEKILKETSNDPFLKGWVDFLLDFSDEKLEKFQQYADITMQIFREKNLTLFQRAFLCMDDFSYFYGNARPNGEVWIYGHSPSDFWRRYEWHIILKGEGVIRSNEHSKAPCFKNLLERLRKSEKKCLADKMQEVIDTTDLSQKNWWEQLLIKEETAFDGSYSIRYWYHDGTQPDTPDQDKYYKVELLSGVRSRNNVKDLLDYGFYRYCIKKGLAKEGEHKRGKNTKSHFSLNEKEVLCDSEKSVICIGDTEYGIKLELGNDVFKQFDDILDSYSS